MTDLFKFLTDWQITWALFAPHCQSRLGKMHILGNIDMTNNPRSSKGSP